MKKTLILLIMIMTIYSCQKEIQNENNGSVIYKLNNIPTNEQNSKSLTNLEPLLINDDDDDDEKINIYLYEISLATRELIKIADFNQTIINMATNSETHTANLLELETEALTYFNTINNNLAAKNLSLAIIADDLTHAPVAPNTDYPETAVVEQYVPAIYIPNLENINSQLQPLISPNIEVDSRENESIEDNIIAWYYENEDSDTLSEALISEEIAMNTENPIFLLDNAVTTLTTEENKNFSPLNTQRLATDGIITEGDLSFSSYEHSIKSTDYRYESGWSGKSEFAVTAIRIEPDGTTNLIYQSNSGTFQSYQVISKIKKNQIGQMRYVWAYHASDWKPWSNPWTPNVTQTGVNMVFWNTFERDWNRSPKQLGTCTACETTINLSGEMKYSSNWYTWIPSTTNIHYTRFEWIYNDWAHWNNSWKADFRLWRVGS